MIVSRDLVVMAKRSPGHAGRASRYRLRSKTRRAQQACRAKDQRLIARHAPHRAPPIVYRFAVNKPGLRDGKWLAPCRGDDVMRRLSAAPARGVVTPSCYRLRVCTSMVTTTATRTKTTTMASASKDPIALISVRPAIFPNVNSSEGRSRATNRTGGHYCVLPPPRTCDAVLDARRMRRQRRPFRVPLGA